MYAAANILVCDTDKTYTVLNRYNPKTHSFEGEYSLLHNEYSNDSYFLCTFLMEHRGHNLMMVTSDDERYFQVKRDYRHFAEEDIEQYMHELTKLREEKENDLSTRLQMGQLQLMVAKKMIEQEWESVQNRESRSDEDTYVLLGQDYAFRKSLQTINQVVEFGAK